MSSHRYLLIVNPAGGSGKTMKALPEIESLLAERNVDYEFHFTREPYHATDIVRARGDKFDVIVSVGGDGTINEIINGLPDINKPLGIIPIGTGNDFARSCCIPYDNIHEAINILLNHDSRHVDLGVANDYRFINVMGLGFEGRSSEIGRALTMLKGPVKYLVAIGYTLFAYKRIPVKITIGDQVIEEKTFLISIGNGWNVGGGLQLTPRAKLDDGMFDICYVKNISRYRIVSNFTRLYNGTIDELDEIEMYRGKHITIESDVQLPLHLDGEVLNGDRSNINITILPKAQEIIGNWTGDTRFD